jgi:hypothetical protein
MPFSRLWLSKSLAGRLASLGLQPPSLLQANAISSICRRLPHSSDDLRWSFARESLVIRAAAGSERTLVYLLPLLDAANGTQGISTAIAVPSLDIGMQIHDQISYLLGPSSVELVDLHEMGDIQTQPTIVIGPLRSLARIPQERYQNLRCVVLDEADKILRPPGRYEPYRRQKCLSRKRQSVLEALHYIMGGDHKVLMRQNHIEGNHDEEEDNDDAFKSDDHIEPSLRLGKAIAPLLIAVSATANNPLRHLLKVSGLVHRVKVLLVNSVQKEDTIFPIQ